MAIYRQYEYGPDAMDRIARRYERTAKNPSDPEAFSYPPDWFSGVPLESAARSMAQQLKEIADRVRKMHTENRRKEY